jgi:hypothetical protein|uniref:Uncharacterized protein n=1 Tax=viral metagenome TaxID=1070528 RepID=A0A6C0BW84_9ZZZZ
MIIEEKLWFINYIKKIDKLTQWDLFIVRFIRQLLHDTDPIIMEYHDDLLEIVLKIISTQPVVNFIKLTHPHVEFVQFNELVRDLINIYLMRQEDYNYLK